MSGNIVTILGTRQCYGGHNRHQEESWIARQFLIHLHQHETIFDHPYLFKLHVFLLQITIKYSLVARKIVEVVERWRVDGFDCQSEVFLANYVTSLIDDDEQYYLDTICDEIKMSTL